MAVAPASLADQIIVLDDDDNVEEARPQPSSSAATPSSSKHQAKGRSSPKNQHRVSTHITQSPFSSAKKNTNALQIENQKLFDEFVQHCTPLTKDCPEVLTFLQTKHGKACPDYLCSVEFRNTLGHCLTRAQASKSKTFVYIKELCTVLQQHALKKRQALTKVEPAAAEQGSHQSTSTTLKSKDKVKGKAGEEDEEVKPEEEDQPSSSGEKGEAGEENQETDKKARRSLKKQIAYLENLLKLYNDEIYRLQQAELSLDDMETEDSTYIQEHKLKRKMMKIYEKLCELKGCDTLTGRVIEQRITYSGTRYPEINKKIERFINSPEAHRNPPDYHDILQQVIRVNERHNLCLSRKQLNQIAAEAFRETGSRLQERRHLDLVYNFGSRLTDTYKPATDPALSDPSLMRKLRSNREVALSRLDEVITKYAVKQDDTEEQERQRRMEKDKENQKLEDEAKAKQAGGASRNEEEDEEEEEDDEEDESSDPDIEEEIVASTQHDGADDDDDNEDDNDNEADEGCDDVDNKEDQTYDQSESVAAADEEDLKDEGDPDSDETQISPMTDIPSPRDSPSQSEAMQTNEPQPSTNGSPAASQQSVTSSSQLSVVLVKVKEKATEVNPSASTNGNPSPEQKTVTVGQSDTQTTNGTSPPPSPRTTRSQKRKREETRSTNSRNIKQKISFDSDADISLDMGVICCSSPEKMESSVFETPTKNPIISLESTPPPKKNKVNVATQCDPDEIIVLSDSD
ncbi:death domain-associated protein 6 isoform X2 [Cyprinodon tularosa]|uniref:death domain-associated protein 6 isoform X2 n=1 Tax=Cyprinodon tularosa TaxID=77115 RepID=UPI0018E269C7|nr:death domain-associated protein 6 isoform X2 [Cyprinodon tularosa]